MNRPAILSKPVTLANGETVPLEQAADAYGLLDAYTHGHDLEWEPLALLRQLAFGQPIFPEQTRTLVREKLVDGNGTLDPVLRSVILSAVRGEGKALRLESPFTEPTDRAVAELLNAQDHVRDHLPADEVHALLHYDPVGTFLSKLRPPSRPDDPSAGPSR